MFIGSYLFNFVGAVVRWIYGTIWRTIAKKKRFTFREYLNGPDNSDDWFDLTGHGVVNNVIGFTAIVLICWIILELGF
jgi:hypothetical protein